MKKISKMNFRQVRNGEHFGFHSNVREVFTAQVAAQYGMAEAYAAYTVLFEKEQEVYAEKLSYATTEQIEETDKLRDDLYVYMKQMVDAKLKSPVVADVTAAKAIDYEMQRYRNANKEAYMENTFQLRQLLRALKTAEMEAQCREIGIWNVVEQLEEANEQFNTLFNNRGDEIRDRDATINLKELRPRLDQAYFTCTEMINAIFMANEIYFHAEGISEALAQVIDKINTQVVMLTKIVEKRTGKSSSNDSEDEDEFSGVEPTPGPGTNPAEGGEGEGGNTPVVTEPEDPTPGGDDNPSGDDNPGGGDPGTGGFMG